MKTINKLATIIVLMCSLASCYPKEVYYPPYRGYLEIENATADTVTFLLVRHSSTFEGNSFRDVPPYVRETSKNIIEPGDAQIPFMYSHTFSYIEDIDFTECRVYSYKHQRLLFFKGDISNELAKLPKSDNGRFLQSAWDESIEGKIIFEISDDIFTPDHWTQRIQDEPEDGEYLEKYNDLEIDDPTWYKYVYWTFTLTDEHLAEYAAKKGTVE